MMLLYVLLGILIWNLITLIVFIVSREDSNLGVIVGCGAFYFIALAFCWIVRKVRYRKRK